MYWKVPRIVPVPPVSGVDRRRRGRQPSASSRRCTAAGCFAPGRSRAASRRTSSASRCRASDRDGRCRAGGPRRARRGSRSRCVGRRPSGSGAFVEPRRERLALRGIPGPRKARRRFNPSGFADVVERADVRVVELPRSSSLPAIESMRGTAGSCAASSLRQDLDRDRPASSRVSRAWYTCAHAAGADGRNRCSYGPRRVRGGQRHRRTAACGSWRAPRGAAAEGGMNRKRDYNGTAASRSSLHSLPRFVPAAGHGRLLPPGLRRAWCAQITTMSEVRRETFLRDQRE